MQYFQSDKKSGKTNKNKIIQSIDPTLWTKNEYFISLETPQNPLEIDTEEITRIESPKSRNDSQLREIKTTSE